MGGGKYASVNFRSVQEMARAGIASVDAILAYAVAHGIGHLLLNTPNHTTAGIMRERWDRHDLECIARSCLVFAKEQSMRMERSAVARVEGSVFPNQAVRARFR